MADKWIKYLHSKSEDNVPISVSASQQAPGDPYWYRSENIPFIAVYSLGEVGKPMHAESLTASTKIPFRLGVCRHKFPAIEASIKARKINAGNIGGLSGTITPNQDN